MKKRTPIVGRVILTLILLFLVAGMLLPTVLTAVGSFMSQAEIDHTYGSVFSSIDQGGTYIEGETALTLFPKTGTFSQYVITLLQTPAYLNRFWNSVCLTLPIVLGQLVIASMASYSLYRCRNRFRSAVFFFYVIVMLLPYQVTLLPNYLVADRLGVLGTSWAILLPDMVSPFAVFLITRFMRRIPTAQLEAAALDGAGEWRIFTRICLPQCRSILWAVAMLIFVDYWNMIEQPMILLDDPAKYPLSIYLSEINATGTGMAFAVATLYLVPPLLLFFYGQRHFVAGFGVAAAKEPSPHRWVRVWRRWVLPTVAVMFFVALFLLTRFADTINPRFTPEVTVTAPGMSLSDDGRYVLTLPEETVHEDVYGQYVLALREQTGEDTVVYRAARVAVIASPAEEGVVTVTGELDVADRVIHTYTALPEENQFVTPVK